VSKPSKLELAERFGLSIPDTALAMGISGQRVLALAADGILDARKLGHKTIITVESIRRCVDALPKANIRVPSIVARFAALDAPQPAPPKPRRPGRPSNAELGARRAANANEADDAPEAA